MGVRYHVRGRAIFLGTAKGQCAVLLAIATVLVTSGAFVWCLAEGSEDVPATFWPHALWFSWGLFFDPGTQTGVPATPVHQALVAMAFSVTGFIFNLVALG